MIHIYICSCIYTTPTSTSHSCCDIVINRENDDDDDTRYNYFYNVEHTANVLRTIVPKLLMKTNEKCQQTKNVWGIYESQRCNGERIYFTCNNLGVLTRLIPYSTTNTMTLFYYNPHTHHVWIAKEDTHVPYYLQEQLLSPQNLQFQLTNAVIALYHPIYLPMTTILDH